MTLTKQARDAIARAVGRLRTLFETEFANQAKGRFGFHVQRRAAVEVGDESGEEVLLRPWVEPLSALSLSPSQATQRAELIGALSYLRREGLDGGEAVARLVREAAFTSVNRLLAVRVGEAIGVLPEITANGRQSASYREASQDLFPLLAQEDDEGFWRYLQVAGDELGATVPLLFDRRLPVSAFVPSRTCVDRALELLNDPSVADVWAEPEALGWAYQFFNGDDVREMREVSSQAPRTSRELAVRNQFFTPRYIVEWLVQNTLGRRLRQGGFAVELPLLVGEVDSAVAVELEDIKILDPACGSGHFLLGCYDLLEQAWSERGVQPEEAGPSILRSLYGIEIDPRASQVAQAVLLLRARRAAPGAAFAPPEIVTARPLPGAVDVRRAAFERLSPNARDLAEEIDAALVDAPVLGSLLKAEERLAAAIKRTLQTPKLATGTVSETVLELELLTAAEDIARQGDASPAERMFGADARDSIRFLTLCQHRYDVVLMNPPFGDPVPETRDYLRAAYGASGVDLYSAFVHRGAELLTEHGFVGAITSRTGFFLTTYEEWRREVVLPRMHAMIDLGVGVMHGAMVEAAAYVIGWKPHKGNAVFRRLLDEPAKGPAVHSGAGETYVRQPSDFADIPGGPAAYWIDDALLKVFRANPTMKTIAGVEVRQGLATADDFRFVRLWWEVPEDRVGFGKRWVPFAKGGDYSPYYSDLDLVVEWENEGARIVEFGRGRVQNTQHYFRPGLTWSLRTQKGFSVRPVPAGSVFGHKGPMIFVGSNDPADLDRLMAYLNSGVASALLEAMVAFGSYEVGTVQRLPYVETDKVTGEAARALTATRVADAEGVETTHVFLTPWVHRGTQSRDEVIGASQSVDAAVLSGVGIQDSLTPLSAAYPSGWFAEEYGLRSEPSAHTELSYLLGAAMGRWDIRLATGDVGSPDPPDPYEPLSGTAAGMLLENGHPPASPPSGYPIAVPTDRLLYDEPGHAQDVVAAIERAAATVASGTAGAKLRFANEIRDLRQHLRTRFFSQHLKEYSGSRRYAPIYWYLAVPSKEWGIWAYAPALSREMMFAIAGAARDRLRRVREQAAQLRGQVGAGGSREDVERVEKLDALEAEVGAFLETAEGVAQSGWTPDLSDGSILCAAPLEPLFADERWRREVASQRKKLQKGGYPWAAVQAGYFGVKS